MKRNDNQIYSTAAFKTAKRIAITIVCCLPGLILFGYFTKNVITNTALQIFLNVVIMGVVVLIVELVARKRESKRIADKVMHDKKDVFK